MVGAVPREGERIVQTRIGPSLIKRGSRFAWLALIDSAKILTITGARSWLLPTKSYRVKRLLLHFTFYRADAVLYRSTYLFLYQLSTLPCFFWPQGLLHIIAKMYVQDVSACYPHVSEAPVSQYAGYGRSNSSACVSFCCSKSIKAATFVWTISLVPTNVALIESLFLAEFCIAGQRSINIKEVSCDGCYQYFHWSHQSTALHCVVQFNSLPTIVS